MQPLCHADTTSVYYIFVMEFLFWFVSVSYESTDVSETYHGRTVARGMTESQLYSFVSLKIVLGFKLVISLAFKYF